MKIKKIISALLASTMLISALPAFADDEVNANAVTEKKFSAADVEVAKTRIDVKGEKNGLNICTQWTDNNKDTSDKTEYGRLYKLNNVFGLGENEYGLEMTAREQREQQPYMMYSPQIVYDLSESFYITYDVYVGDMRDNDFFRMGGQFYDGTSTAKEDRKMFFPFFRGTGVIQSGTSETGNSTGAYVPNNWYKQTLAYDKNANTVTYYIDGKVWGSTATPTKDVVSNLTLGVRIDPSNEKTDGFGGAPSWFVLKEAEIKKGTYDATKSITTVTSNDYTVNDKSIVQQANAKATDAVSSISGVAPNTTVSDFMSKITAPTDGSVSIVKIASDSGETQAVESTETVTSEMSVLAKSADGAMKLYNVVLTEDTSLLPTLSVAADAPSAYTIDDDENVVTVCDAKLSTLRTRFTVGEGEEIKFEKYDGTEITDEDKFVDKSMKLVAVKGDKEVEYSIQIKNTEIFTPSAGLSNLADGTQLIHGTNTQGTNDKGETIYTINFDQNYYNNASHMNKLYNFGSPDGGGGNGVQNSFWKINNGEFTATKTSLADGTPAYHFQASTDEADKEASGTDTTSWVSVNSKFLKDSKVYTETSAPKKTVISLRAKIAEGGKLAIQPNHCNTNNQSAPVDGTSNDTVYMWKTWAVVGGRLASNGGRDGDKITEGAYTYGQEVKVDIVENTQTVYTEDGQSISKVVVDGVYIDGTMLTGSNTTRTVYSAGNSVQLKNIIRYLGLQTYGDVTVGDIKIYLADDYNPNPTEGDKPEEVNLNLWSDSYENPVQISESGKITGWKGQTIEQIKTQLNCANGAVFEVRTADDMKLVTDNTLLEDNMLVVVSDPFYTDRKAYYYLAGDNEWDNYTVTEETKDDVTTITVKRNYFAYDKPEENIPARMIFASYDADGNLANIQVLNKKINGAGDWDFSVELPKTANTYKVFMWNSETQAPMEDVYNPLANNN